MSRSIGTGRASGPTGRSGASGGWFARFLHDLFTPRSIATVAPPRPRTRRDYVRTLIVRGVVTELISGPESTFVEKAAFVFAPDVAPIAARIGAEKGQRDLWESPPARPGVIDV